VQTLFKHTVGIQQLLVPFFCEHVTKTYNKLHDRVNFSSVKAFKRPAQNYDFTTF